MKKFCFLILLFVFIKTYSQPTKLSFDYLNVENGLPENAIKDLMQDKLGYLWIGTRNGLVRYDGYTTKLYDLNAGKNGNNSNVDVRTIFEDKAGTLWIGTDVSGLFRYNRATDSFTQYRHDVKNPNSIDDNWVETIVEDSLGNLWMVVGPGAAPELNILNPQTDNFKVFNPKSHNAATATPFKEIYSFSTDSNRKIWIGTENGLYTYNNNKFYGYGVSSDTSHKKGFFVINQPLSQKLWVLSRINEEPIMMSVLDTRLHTFTDVDIIPKDTSGITTNNIACIYEDHKNRLWFGTYNGLSLYNRNEKKFYNYSWKDNYGVSSIPSPGNSNAVYNITEDASGMLWLKGELGIRYFNPNTLTFSKRFEVSDDDPTGLKSNTITKIVKDNFGSLWVGTFYNGLHHLNPVSSLFTFTRHNASKKESFPGGYVNHFADGKDGTYYISTTKGLLHWIPQSGKFTKINYPSDEIGDPYIRSLFVDEMGFVWFSNDTHGIFKYNPKNGMVSRFLIHGKDPVDFRNNSSTCIYQDHNQDLWIGTYRTGIYKLNNKTGSYIHYDYVHDTAFIDHKKNRGRLDDDHVNFITEDRQGVLWVGTEFGGLNRFNSKDGTFTTYYDPVKGIINVTNIFEDKEGSFWFGTYANGLFLLDRKSGHTQHFTEKDGLLQNFVAGIAQDDSGYLWLNSERGLSRFDLKNHVFKNYTKASGLPETNFPGSSLFTKEGVLLVGGNEGFLSFRPQEIAPNLIPPRVVLESLHYLQPETKGVQEKEIDIKLYSRNEVDLKYNENRFTIYYVGLHFQNPALNQYEYMLEGFDKSWIHAGAQRSATYTNLSPGTYTFYVKASNSDGIWSKEAVSVKIVIQPPWWRTWWAYSFYLICFVTIALFANRFIRNRIIVKERIKAREKELAQAKEIEKAYHELKATQAQLIQSEKMASLGELTAGIAHEIQNPLNFVNNFSEVNNELADEINSENDIDEIRAIAKDIKQNSEKILYHGKRADAIIKGMLQHSRQTKGVKEPTDINALCDEYLRLSYHGLRAKDKNFNVDFKTDFDESIGKINIIPQDIGRVLLNLYNNAFYAVSEKKKQQADNYEPTVSVSTKKIGDKVEIKVSDNGNGIPQNIVDKIFQPFFTTKPTGQGTGLGLSLSYDIIKAHGGEIKVETKEGEGAKFIIQLPG